MDGGCWPSWSSGVVRVVVSLERCWEWIAPSKVKHTLHSILLCEVTSAQIRPWLPLLHNLEQFDFIMCLEDELLDQAGGDLLLNSANRHGLVHDGHSEPGELLAQELVSVLVWHVLQLLQAEVIEFHELHSWEGLDVQEGDTGGQLY